MSDARQWLTAAFSSCVITSQIANNCQYKVASWILIVNITITITSVKEKENERERERETERVIYYYTVCLLYSFAVVSWIILKKIKITRLY